MIDKQLKIALIEIMDVQVINEINTPFGNIKIKVHKMKNRKSRKEN
jgi:hypothetical protein